MSIPPEAGSLIDGAPVSAHVATSVADRPHVAPIWYGYRDGVVYFLTGGRKLENLRQNPRVALSMESANAGDVDWNVTLFGRATVVDDPDRMDWAKGWIYDAYEDDTGAESDPALETDGGEAGDGDAALVEVTVNSAAWNVYD